MKEVSEELGIPSLEVRICLKFYTTFNGHLKVPNTFDTHPIVCGSKNKLCCVSCTVCQLGCGYARLDKRSFKIKNGGPRFKGAGI